MNKTMRIAAISYLHGLSGVGLFQRVELPYRLSPESIESGLQKHYFRLAMNALILGGVVSITSVISFALLVTGGHETIASLVLVSLGLQHVAGFFIRPARS